MLEQVELKIQELQKKQTEEYYKKKDEDLAAWGLTAKKDGKKSIPIIVTDEEYEALIKASNGVGRSGRNSFAIAFNVISATIMFLGAIGGIVLGYLSDSLGFVYFSLVVLGSALVAFLFRGLGEVIRLLQQIVDGKPAPISDEQKAAYAAEKAEADPYAQSPVQEQPYFAPQAPAYQVPYPPQYGQAPYSQPYPPQYGQPAPSPYAQPYVAPQPSAEQPTYPQSTDTTSF